MAPKNLDKIASLKVKGSTPPPPNPGDDWDKAFNDALNATTTTTPTTVPRTTTGSSPTVTTPAVTVPKPPKNLTPIKAGERVPDTSSPIIGKNKYGYVTQDNKIVKFSNFKPDSPSVVYNPGPKTKPSTTKAPTTPSTTVPKTETVIINGRRQIVTAEEAARLLAAQEQRAANLGITTEEVQQAEAGKKPGGFWGAVSKVINFDVIPGKHEFRPIARAVVPSLGALQAGGRAVLSVNENLIDRVKQFQGTAAKYEAGDYIPVHKQTGLPIAKEGDYVIRNWADIINVPINTDKYKTPEQVVKGVEDLVKSRAQTSAGSARETIKAVQDFTYSASDNPYVPSVGNKYIDGVINFGYDVLTDPVTYATMGGSALVAPVEEAAARGGTKVASKAGLLAAEREAARVAAEEAAAKAAAAAGTAGEKAAAAAAEKAAAIAEDLFKKAAAAAPRRVYGRAAREALADQIRVIRQTAQTVIDDAAASAAEKVVAENAVKVLTDDFIKEVAAKGYSVIRGEAAKTLGVRSGIRIGLPGFGKATIPYTSKLTEFIGSSLAKPRFAFFQTKAGNAILDAITPTGEGGLFGSESILKMRTALRNGTATPAEAVDYAALLSADKFYRGSLDLARKKAATAIGRITTGKAKKILEGISEHLTTPEAEWAAKGLRALTKDEQVVYQATKDVLNNFWKEANGKAAILGASALPSLTDYWPRSQSEQAIEWAAKNAGEADKIASGLGVDRTFFLGNFTSRTLEKGKVWFGQVLDGTETIQDLNKIAKDSGVIDFNFFETDPVKALVGYANTHAKYIAYADAINKLTKISPAAAGGFAEDISTKVPAIIPTTKPGISELGSVENSIANFMSADRLANWSEAAILDVRDKIAALRTKLAGSSDIVKREFNDAVMEIDEKIAATTRLINAGIIDPTAGSLVRAELEAYANDLALSISNAKREFLVTGVDRWKNVGKVLEDGFTVLNDKTIPDIAVRADIAEIFKNVKRLDDPAFARAAEAVLKDYNTFFKSAVTTTLGFHTRNALSNAFIMFASGAEPGNLIKGLKIYRAWKTASKAGMSPEKFIDSIVAKGLIKEAESKAVLEAIAYSGATGFGQFGEIASAAGVGRPGVFGKEATGKIPFTQKEVPALKKASEILGTPFYGSRKLGSTIEELNRFQLTYDGLMQGLDSATAAARTSKFLIDYNDLSTLDRNIKQIIPFWTWTSRNMPLQIENMWIDPVAYTTYAKFKNNLEDKNGTSAWLPDYLKEAGAFKLPGTDFYLKPDLGFPGAQGPNIIQQIIEGKGLEAISSLTPALRIPIEDAINKKFFSGAKIGGALDQWNYTVQQGVPGLSTIGRILTAIPGTEPKWLKTLTGAQADETSRGILSFIGSPAFKLLDRQEKSEVWRRYFLVKDYIDTVLNARKKQNRGG